MELVLIPAQVEMNSDGNRLVEGVESAPLRTECQGRDGTEEKHWYSHN